MAGTAASVLAVDDNATIRKSISMRLGSMGFSVTTAEDGAQALDILDSENFDVVLLDLKMPGLQGEEVLRRVRTRFSEVQLPVIILAASDCKEDITRTLELGANDYVIKPGELPILVARINTQLSLKRTMAQLERAAQAVGSGTAEALGVVELPPNVLPYRSAGEYRERDSDAASLYRRLYEDLPVACFMLDRHGQVLAVNRYASSFFGFGREEMLHKSIFDFYVEDDRMAAHQCLSSVVQVEDRLHSWEVSRRKKSGTKVWVRETARSLRRPSGEINILLTCEDIDENYRLTERISYQASHDEMTGLANRKSLEARLEQVIESAHAERTEHALAYIDLDQFKIVNDTCGHLAGDKLLQEVARLLKTSVRKRDTLARMSGDEFAILIEDCQLEPAVIAVNEIRRAISAYKFNWGPRQYPITASIGIVPVNYSCEGVGAALSMADTACYAAKDSGRDRVHVYQSDDDRVATRHGEMRWATRIQDALIEDRFFLSYQPIVPIGHSPARGEHYELLLRMRDEFGNTVAPGEFLPAAERYNLTEQLDRWVIQRALKWFRQHPDKLENLHLCAINLSGKSLGNEEILKLILDEFNDSTVPPEKICFEVTETAAISDLVSAAHFVTHLRERGCRFALDDFGSGFSSFTYLKTLPVDYLKIDGTFVRDIARDNIDFAMVRSINEIGHVMGKQTIAEFVEDDIILAKLAEIGVDYAQGYGIGRPRPLDESVTGG